MRPGRRAAAYLAVAVIAYGFFLLAQFPAAALADRVAAYADVRRLEGGVLAGRAAGVRWRSLSVETLAWRWQPWALALGRLQYRLEIDRPDIDLSARIAIDWRGGVRVQRLRGHLPLSAVAAVSGLPLPLTGRLELDLHGQARLGQAGLPEAHGRLRLSDARAPLLGELPLGDFLATLSTAAPADGQTALALRAAIEDAGGPLALEGVLTVDSRGRYRFSGEAALRDAADPRLEQAVGVLGRPGADGKRRFNLTGVLPL